MTIKINQEVLSDRDMYRKDLQTLTLVGLNRENPVLDPVSVQHLYKLLFIF